MATPTTKVYLLTRMDSTSREKPAITKRDIFARDEEEALGDDCKWAHARYPSLSMILGVGIPKGGDEKFIGLKAGSDLDALKQHMVDLVKAEVNPIIEGMVADVNVTWLPPNFPSGSNEHTSALVTLDRLTERQMRFVRFEIYFFESDPPAF